MSEMTYEEWSAKYRPIKNHLVEDDTTSFETYGDEVLFVCEQPNSTVWTELDGEEGVYLVSGYHLANRIAYYVTDVPWDDSDDICVTICKFVVCDCYDVDDEETEPDQDCDQCGGDGTYTDWNY
jgi:hypothetical protein